MNLTNVSSKTTLNRHTQLDKGTQSDLSNATAFDVGRVKVSTKADHFPASNSQSVDFALVNFEPVDKGIVERGLIENSSEANLGKLLKSHFGSQVILNKLKEPKSNKDQNTSSEQAEDAEYDQAWNDVTDGHWLAQDSAEALWYEEIQQNDWFSPEENIWQHALQAEEETRKNPECKPRINLHDAKPRNELFNKKDAIESAVILTVNALQHLGDTSVNTKPSFSMPSFFPKAEAVPVLEIKKPEAVEYAKQYAQWQQGNNISTGSTNIGVHRTKRRAYGLPGAFNAMRIQLSLTLRDKIARTRQEKFALIRQAINNKGPKDSALTLAAGGALQDVLSMGPMALWAPN